MEKKVPQVLVETMDAAAVVMSGLIVLDLLGSEEAQKLFMLLSDLGTALAKKTAEHYDQEEIDQAINAIHSARLLRCVSTEGTIQ